VLCCAVQPTKRIARTLLSSQKASTITFVDDAAWPALFDSQLDTTRRGGDCRGEGEGEEEEGEEEEDGEQRRRKQVARSEWCSGCGGGQCHARSDGHWRTSILHFICLIQTTKTLNCVMVCV